MLRQRRPLFFLVLRRLTSLAFRGGVSKSRSVSTHSTHPGLKPRVYSGLIFSVFTLAFSILPLAAQDLSPERVLSFHSEISVHEDASMTVTEMIRVKSSGVNIKHGIYRDFPTDYRDRLGNRYRVDFNPTKALRDGVPESYRLQNLRNGKRVYIGNKDVILSPGEYTYTLIYETNRQLGFFKDHDELYWNITGNGWGFPISEASAVVQLPTGVPTSKVTWNAYTGYPGSINKDYSAFTDTSGSVNFVTTKPLAPFEGLTIVVSWPKGFVRQPSTEARIQYFYHDNLGLIIGVIGLLAVVGYYLIVWAMVGRDPKKGTIIPLYSPEDNLSAADMRYILRMSFDHKAFTATVINMAVKGFLKISQSRGAYKIIKAGVDEGVLSEEEMIVAKKLLGKSKEIELESANHVIIQQALSALKNFLRLHFEKVYFFTNTKYFIPGAILSLLMTITSGAVSALESGSSDKLFLAVFICFWLSIWSVGVAALLQNCIALWRGRALAKAVALMLFAVPFVVGEIFGLSVLVYATSVVTVFILVTIITVNLLFYHLLKAPTLAGRKIIDKIYGFKMYLSTAEKERLNLLNPPEMTPELFEKYLPYALALDVEQGWSERFSAAMNAAGKSDKDYTPVWYSAASTGVLSVGAFSSSLSNSFSSAISSSATAPGLSSGSSGGGSSGGGGGGGGGGGW